MPVIALSMDNCAPDMTSPDAADHTLRGFKDAHDDVPCVGDDQHRRGGFEHPFEDDERIEIVKVVLVDDHLNEFERRDDGENRARNGDDHMIRKPLNHGENAAVPLLRGLAYVVGNAGDLGIHLSNSPGQVIHNTLDEQLPNPFREFIPDKISKRITLFLEERCRMGVQQRSRNFLLHHA